MFQCDHYEFVLFSYFTQLTILESQVEIDLQSWRTRRVFSIFSDTKHDNI